VKGIKRARLEEEREDLHELLGEVGIHSAELPECRENGSWLERVEVPHGRGWEFARTAVI